MRIQRLKDGVLWIAAANDEEVKTVIISAGTWHGTYTKEKNVRQCDPDKNTECRKTSCFINGGECHMTEKKECWDETD